MREAWLPPLLAALTLSPCLAQGVPPTLSRGEAAVPAEPLHPATGLSLSAAIELALARHPQLAATRSEILAAEAAELQASVRPNPVLESEIEDTRRDARSTTVLLTQPIELGGKREARMEAARRAGAVARSQYALARSQLRADVTAAFVNTLIARERLHAAEASLDLARRATDAATKRVTAGKVSPIDETKAKVAEANVRVEHIRAAGELRAAAQLLQTIIGVPQPLQSVDGHIALPFVPSEAALRERLVGAPALQQAELEIERLGALAQLERARRIPDVMVGVGARRSEELGRTQAVLTLSVPLPVFDTNRGAELEAIRRQDKARHEAHAAALRLQTEVTQAYEQLRGAVAEAQALQQEVLPGAQVAYDAAAKGFELGKFGFLDVLDAQRTLLEARDRHLRAVAQAHRATTDIDRLLGKQPWSASPKEQETQ